jgi:oligopeptidase B
VTRQPDALPSPALPTPPAAPSPPVAVRRPKILEAHGDQRVDELWWLRERSDETMAHLAAENAYTDAMLAATEPLQQELYDEIRSHIEEADLSVPVRRGPFWYYTRTVEEQSYLVHCRKPASGDDRTPPAPDSGDDASGVEEVLLDVNRQAAGHDFFRVATFDVSPDHRLLAWSSDTAGDERYTVRFRDLTTGRDLPDVIPDTYYGSAWAADNATFFYVRPDAAMRPHQLWRHRLGTPAENDVLIHQEDDERFFLTVGATKDEQILVLTLTSAVTAECRWLPASEPEGAWQVVAARRQDIEYSVEHLGDRFYIVTNDGAPNFRLVEAPVTDSGPEHWVDVLPPDPSVRLLSVEVFDRHLLLHERADGLTRLRILELGSGDVHEIALPETPGTVEPAYTPDLDSPLVRYTFASLRTPMTVVDYDLRDRTGTVRKVQPVPGYDPADYVTERSWATAPDGVRVPISLVHRRDLQRPAPCLLYGYGSYEISVDPMFAATRLPLLDRGFSYAIAHIRGGGEMGRSWYDDGKLLRKTNTFTDFIACADHLVAEGITEAGRIVARGASAGGLLMGAVTNRRPELFAGVQAGVPFVDCLTTILDPSLPLTVIEWEEWGNPVDDPAVYAYMKSYSPYDNVSAQAYPPIFAVTGLNDTRVGFWEPAKWVQRLRERTTGDAPVLLRVEMGTGHSGPSGRYEAWRREALLLAWMLSVTG